MIDNPNPRSFYSPQEMEDREAFVPQMKERLLQNLEQLRNKIATEEPYPHGNMSLDDLVEFDDRIQEILNCWYY